MLLMPINERAITEKLENFYKGKTVVVVAHRLSTVRNAANSHFDVLGRGVKRDYLC